jgi:hypothetical protein
MVRSGCYRGNPPLGAIQIYTESLRAMDLGSIPRLQEDVALTIQMDG